jgi:DNA modification methylase
MRHTILHADVMDGLRSLPDRSVHCIITSPPYWGLRDYGVEGQIGLEPTPEEYVEKMVEVFREVRRVLRDDGTLWLNLGDSYNGSGGAGGDYAPGGLKAGQPKYPGRRISALKPKDLVGIPWRVAFALQEDGWYLRSDIIWHKPNPMPESVRDRPTKAHEHMFLLTKSRKYYYDADAVREPCVGGTGWAKSHAHKAGHGNEATARDARLGCNPLGRNRRDVWTIPTRPYKGAHFATFPPALVEPCLLAGTSERGACPECGAPWRRVTERGENTGKNGRYDASETTLRNDAAKHSGRIGETPVHTVGWQPSCACGTEETVPCIVLDPFAGSGTVNLVAHGLGRSSVGIELNEKYIDIIKSRWARGGRPAEALEVRAI